MFTMMVVTSAQAGEWEQRKARDETGRRMLTFVLQNIQLVG
jgi:hypothetical protein